MNRGRPALLVSLLALLTAVTWGAAPSAVPSAVAAQPSPGEPGRAQQSWHGDQARVPAAQPGGRYGDGVVVAVLDSWVDGSHPDFGGRVLPGADCVGGTCRAGQQADQCAHGTHVAGTVAASSYGVAPSAQVLPVRVLAYDPAATRCVGKPADVAAGVAWATRSGAQIINLSLGPDVADVAGAGELRAAFAAAARAGVLVVFAAGGGGATGDDAYGADVLVVAATDASGQLAGYSQRGPAIDVSAPGGQPGPDGVCASAGCVTSTYPGGGYALAAGTSMAAPHVAGTAALLLAGGLVRTPAEATLRLLSTARPLPSAGAGAGLLDATAAISSGTPPTGPPPVPPSPPSPPPSSAVTPRTALDVVVPGTPQRPDEVQPILDPARPADPTAMPVAPAAGVPWERVGLAVALVVAGVTALRLRERG